MMFVTKMELNINVEHTSLGARCYIQCRYNETFNNLRFIFPYYIFHIVFDDIVFKTKTNGIYTFISKDEYEKCNYELFIKSPATIEIIGPISDIAKLKLKVS